MAKPPNIQRSEAETAELTRLDRWFIDAGLPDSRRQAADTEFEVNFPTGYVGILSARPQQQALHSEMLKRLNVWLQKLREGEKEPAGVVLSGQVGGGKTALASLLAKEAAAFVGLKPSFISCLEMREDLRGLPMTREEYREHYRHAAHPDEFPVCVIDDAGAESNNPEARDLVQWMLHRRSQQACFTIWTTNNDQDSFAEYLGDERGLSRISYCAWMTLSSKHPDHRRVNS